MLRKFKKIWMSLEFIFGIFIPSIAFAVMFISFCLQIISRYVFHSQIDWTYDCTVIGFLWTVPFGAIWASRTKTHVSFSLVYDMFGPKKRAILSLIGDVLILVAFIIMIPSVYEYIAFINIKKTAVLGFSFALLYAPFLIFILFSAVYLIKTIIKAGKDLCTPTDILIERERLVKEEQQQRALDEEATLRKQISSLNEPVETAANAKRG